MKYDDYITEFNYSNQQHNMSFIRYQHDETEEEKEEIILFFCKHFPNYKFYNSLEHTAFFYKKKDI